MLETLLTHLRQNAPDIVDVPILQPADPFLETAGEDLRRRIFITETANGELNCLRPEFTIPIGMAHLKTSKPARYAYGGTVFRQERRGTSEFQQVGLEDLGNTDIVKADAACVNDMLDTLGVCGIQNPKIILGDQNLFSVVVENLGLPQAISERLVRNFGDANLVNNLIDQLVKSGAVSPRNTELDALAASGNRDALTDRVSQMMLAANLSPKAGRSVQDIADRMIAKSAEGHFQLPADRADVLRKFLALETPLDQASDALISFASESNISFGDALTLFQARAKKLSNKGAVYKASLGRKLDYYTGMLFEAEVDEISVAGGGRYDRLCTLLGAENPIPAVGFSISLDRVEEAKQ